MKPAILLLLFLISFPAYSQDKAAYYIYKANGKKTSYKKMLMSLGDKDIILFGELHNNPVAHWLQYELTADLDETRSLILGAEMFEADNQDEVDAYLNGEIDENGLDTLARLWRNYDTDYAPLLNYAKDHDLKFVATNIPRRYASMVYKKGFEVLGLLSDVEKTWIAPLPILFEPDLPTYQNILKMMGDHGTPELVMAQAIKDATMAHFILQNFIQGQLFIHYNGAYHSNHYEGILWYLKQENEDLNYATISTVLQEDVHKLEEENLNLADFIIVVDNNMTTTY